MSAPVWEHWYRWHVAPGNRLRLGPLSRGHCRLSGLAARSRGSDSLGGNVSLRSLAAGSTYFGSASSMAEVGPEITRSSSRTNPNPGMSAGRCGLQHDPLGNDQPTGSGAIAVERCPLIAALNVRWAAASLSRHHGRRDLIHDLRPAWARGWRPDRGHRRRRPSDHPALGRGHRADQQPQVHQGQHAADRSARIRNRHRRWSPAPRRRQSPSPIPTPGGNAVSAI